jgi:hypothetical protein
MNPAQSYFIWVLMPMYFLACMGLAQTNMLFRKKLKVLYLVNFILTFPVIGYYLYVTQVGGPDWLGGTVFGGALAALLATVFADQSRLTSLWRLPRGIAPPPEYPAEQIGKWDP